MGNSPTIDPISLSIQTGDSAETLPIFLSLPANALTAQALKEWLRTQGLEMSTYTTTLHAAYPLPTIPPTEPAPFVATHWPTNFPIITQAFGANPQIYAAYGLPGHEGLDIRATQESPIMAIAPGVVYEVADRGAYGRHVRLRHGNHRSVYAHLQEWKVELDQVVQGGQLIGLAGSTGNSTGPHLHLTIKLDGATERKETKYPGDIIDPTPFIQHLLPPPPPPGSYVVTKLLAYLRANPTTAASIFAELPTGASCTDLGPRGGTNNLWANVRTPDNVTGWVYNLGSGFRKT